MGLGNHLLDQDRHILIFNHPSEQIATDKEGKSPLQTANRSSLCKLHASLKLVFDRAVLSSLNNGEVQHFGV